MPHQQKPDPAVIEAPHDIAATLFILLWDTLADFLGSAATAVLIRRCVKRAATRMTGFDGFAVTRENFAYHYELPAAWQVSAHGLDALRGLFEELWPLLRDLTGPVVVKRLQGVTAFAHYRLLPAESAS